MAEEFVEECKGSLVRAVLHDRLTVMDPDRLSDLGKFPIQRSMLSPRLVLPEHYRLQISAQRRVIDGYTFSLEKKGENGQWKQCTEDSSFDDFPVHPRKLAMALSCAVLALEGHTLLLQTFGIALRNAKSFTATVHEVDPKGDLKKGRLAMGSSSMTVLAINSNWRLLKLKNHVFQTPVEKLVLNPIQHLIGLDEPRLLFERSEFSVQETIDELNEQQRKVAHPKSLTTALEVAGPPGTGKSRTITELARSILRCTEFGMVIVSERNGAIDAVAEKLVQSCLRLSGSCVEEIVDMELWLSVMTYGAEGSMGSFTKLLTLEGKLEYHPEMRALKARLSAAEAVVEDCSKRQRDLIAEVIGAVAEHFEQFAEAQVLRNRILRNQEDFLGPLRVVNLMQRCHSDASALHPVSEAAVENFIEKHSAVLGSSAYQRFLTGKLRREWLELIKGKVEAAMKADVFDEDKTRAALEHLNDSKEKLATKEKELKELFETSVRVKMSTIGSSGKIHGLWIYEKPKADVRKNSNKLRKKKEAKRINDVARSAIVVFDEAGCIPAYELLGLSAMDIDIRGLVVVGDKHQLPPYDPGSVMRLSHKPPKSILDVSEMERLCSKVDLIHQYRVPKDICKVLETWIYGRNKYISGPLAGVPSSGFRLIDVPFSRDKRRKYVNWNEIDEALRLVKEQMANGRQSILVLSPYKDQQLEIRAKMKREGLEEIPVLSIDQCQGQEADTVILSMVQKPTQFLTKNRFNVALSRCRKNLFLLVDVKKLVLACQEHKWKCADLGRDLLKLAGTEV